MGSDMRGQRTGVVPFAIAVLSAILSITVAGAFAWLMLVPIAGIPAIISLDDEPSRNRLFAEVWFVMLATARLSGRWLYRRLGRHGDAATLQQSLDEYVPIAQFVIGLLLIANELIEIAAGRFRGSGGLALGFGALALAFSARDAARSARQQNLFGLFGPRGREG